MLIFKRADCKSARAAVTVHSGGIYLVSGMSSDGWDVRLENLITRLLVYLFTRQLTRLLVNLSTRLLVYSFTRLLTRQLVNLSTRQLVYLSTRLLLPLIYVNILNF